VGHLLAAARWNQEEDVVRRSAQLLRQRQKIPDLVEVHAGDRRVDLELDTGALQGLDARKRPLEGPRHLPECVVPRGIDAVEADAHAPDAGLADPPCHGIVHQGAVGGHDHPQALRVAVGRDLEDVGPQERLAPRKDDDGPAEGGDLVDEAQASPRVQLPLVGPVDRGGPAVDAGQVAAARHLPGHHAQRPGKDHPVTGRFRFLHMCRMTHPGFSPCL